MRRRQFLRSAVGGAALAGVAHALSLLSEVRAADTPKRRSLKTRGVVLVPEDLTLADWPDRAKQVGLSTIALHHQNSPSAVVRTVQSERGLRFLEKCHRLGLAVEYELHAMGELLPRSLFQKDNTLFRMDEKGRRVVAGNLCISSPRALEIVGENATHLAKALQPTTGRYFMWGDDGSPWCRCPKCRGLSDSEQALVMSNHLLKTIRAEHPNAQVAHLAYAQTMNPPRQVKPEPGVFLEYAPIQRRYDVPLARQATAADRNRLAALDANLQVFPAETAQVLEYWLDVSKASHWTRPAKRLPWNKDVFLSDVETYAARGIRHITSFAAWLDADYVHRYGQPDFLSQYGAGLSG